uniref:Reverse transcriptase domain-containing protein n=1 Tax=Tanacetum cinerariifolium TaxID=118510 RepID=A0A6L2KBJ2_TANCI|nr:hypothetical protein [Tanacetum cinerariifolium]
MPQGANSSFFIPKKAFDSVSWKYLDFILHSLGFGNKWRSSIKECLHSSRASGLVNGSPTSEFSIKRVLRQGDPLSHFLFILVMEGLYCALSNVVNSVLIQGINLGSLNTMISHLFYTYDVVITTEWKKEDLDNIIRVIYVFYLALGLKINICKSNIYGIRVYDEEVSDMATSSRLSSWKANLLSIGGQLTLIKAVLGSLGIYFLSIFKALEAFNLALLQKWCWRIYPFPNTLWVEVIKALHGKEGGFDNHGCMFNGCGTKFGFGMTFGLEILRLISSTTSFITDIRVRNMAYLHDMLLEISLVDTHLVEGSCLCSIAINGLFSIGTSRRIIDAKLLPSLLWRFGDLFAIAVTSIFLFLPLLSIGRIGLSYGSLRKRRNIIFMSLWLLLFGGFEGVAAANSTFIKFSSRTTMVAALI